MILNDAQVEMLGRARRAERITQAKAAEVLGTIQPSYSLMERGIMKTKGTPEQVAALLALLGVQKDEFERLR